MARSAVVIPAALILAGACLAGGITACGGGADHPVAVSPAERAAMQQDLKVAATATTAHDRVLAQTALRAFVADVHRARAAGHLERATADALLARAGVALARAAVEIPSPAAIVVAPKPATPATPAPAFTPAKPGEHPWQHGGKGKDRGKGNRKHGDEGDGGD